MDNPENPENRNKRIELLNVGLDYMVKNNSTNFSIKDIASQANIAVGLFYYYFPSKEIFIDEAISLYMAGFARQAEAVLEDDTLSAQQKIRTIFKSLMIQLENASQVMIKSAQSGHLRIVLPFKIAEGIRPHVIRFIEQSMEKKEINPLKTFNITDLADIVLYGIIGILLNREIPDAKLAENLEIYTQNLLQVKKGA